MEVYLSDLNQTRYTVSLNHIIWNNCTTDIDCPGRSTCAKNQSYLQYPSLCVCSFSLDYIGATCETSGYYGLFFFILNIIGACVTIFATIIGMSLIFNLKRLQRFRFDTLGLTNILSVFYGISLSMVFASAARFYSREIKNDIVWSQPFICLCFLFGTLSILNLSLVWINNVKHTRRLSLVSTKRVIVYRKCLIFYYILFLSTLIYSFIVDNLWITATIVSTGILISLIVYTYGFVRIRRLLHEQQQLVNPKATDYRQLGRTLHAIQFTSGPMIICMISLSVFLIVWAVSGGYANYPGKQINLIYLVLSWFSALLAYLYVIQYLYVNYRWKLEHSKRSEVKSMQRT